MEPAISLEKYEIEELLYSRKLDDSDSELKNLQVELESGLTTDEKNAKVTLRAKFIDSDSSRKVTATINGYFNVNVDENIHEFVIVNGSAILFPYLRSAMSMVSTLDSEDALLIPTINVLSLLEKKAEE